VRQSVARHPNASAALLAKLAQDSVVEVRRAAAPRADLQASG
jgi:hypothetical protein